MNQAQVQYIQLADCLALKIGSLEFDGRGFCYLFWSCLPRRGLCCGFITGNSLSGIALLRVVVFGVVVVGVMTLGVMTLGVMTLDVMILSVMILGVMICAMTIRHSFLGLRGDLANLSLAFSYGAFVGLGLWSNPNGGASPGWRGRLI